MNELDVGTVLPFSSNISQGCVPSPGRHSFCNSSQKKVTFMFFAGIDIAKNSHEAAVIDENGNVVVKPFKFANSLSAGLKSFLLLFREYPQICPCLNSVWRQRAITGSICTQNLQTITLSCM